MKSPEQSIHKSSLIFNQFKTIIISNLLINHRRLLFFKQLLLIIFIFLMSVMMFYILENKMEKLYVKQILTGFNIIVLLFISRSEVMLYVDNRNKMMKFLKAYGMYSGVYILSWIIYSLVIGTIKFTFYIILVFFFLKLNSQYFQALFGSYGSQTFQLTYYNYCLINIMGFLSTYSYSLFAVILIPHNQIGLKLLTTIFFIGMSGVLSPTAIVQSGQLFYQISPTGWLVYLISYKSFSDIVYEQISTYVIIFLCQFLIPLFAAFVIQLCKINIFAVFKAINSLNGSELDKQQQIILEMSQTKKRAQPLLRVHKLNKKIWFKEVLKDISLTINIGELIILYGKNSSGKTTLINIISNVEYFLKGKIEIFKKCEIGISLEDNYFFNQLTVKQNLYFYANIKGITIDDEDQILDRFQLTDFSQKKYYKISGGNRKKLSLACAFLGKNDLIILDEPTMGIDMIVKDQIEKIIINQREINPNLTILISTCQLQFNFIQISNRIVILQNKEIRLNENISDIQNYPDFIIASLNRQQKNCQLFLQYIVENKKIKIILQKLTINFQFQIKQLQIFLQALTQFKLDKNVSISLSKVQDKIKKSIFQSQQNKTNLSQFNNFVNFYQNLQPIKSFWNMVYSCFLYNYYLVIPQLIDKIYFLSIMIIVWFSMVLTLTGLQNEIYITFAQFTYPFISIFIYSHIYTSYLQNRESSYQKALFQMGMKKIPFWISYYIFNQILLTFPFILFLVICIPPEHHSNYSLFQYIMIIFTYNLCFTSFSYFFTIFFTLEHVYINFLPTILFTFYFFFSQLTMNLPQYLQLQFLQFLIPSMSYYTEESTISICYHFTVEFIVYILLFFIIRFVQYKIWNRKKYVGARSKNVQSLREQAISQKLNVCGIIDQKGQQFNKSLLLFNVYLKFNKKRYGIRGMNIAIKEGSICGLNGLNGSGKSTIFKLALNEIFKTYGDIYYNGRQITSSSSNIYEMISVSPQTNYFNQQITVKHHLMIFCSIKGIPFNAQKQYIRNLLKLFDMGEQINQTIQSLSGGNKRKLKIITALLGKPKFIFLDEPTIGIDQFSQYQLKRILQYLSCKHKIICLIITHNIQQIEDICDRAALIKRGSLLYHDSIQRIKNQFCRGYTIKLYSLNFVALLRLIIPLFDNFFKVYEYRQYMSYQMIEFLIPWERIKGDIDLISLCHQWYMKNIIYGYEIRQQKLRNVLSYLIFRSCQKQKKLEVQAKKPSNIFQTKGTNKTSLIDNTY